MIKEFDSNLIKMIVYRVDGLILSTFINLITKLIMAEEIKKEKELRARSRLYPRYDLEDAIEFIQAINKLGGSKVSINAVAAELGKAVNNSGFTGRLSSAKQFGLLVQDEGKLSLSSLGKEIVFPKGEEEKTQAIQKAFTTPVFYRELVEGFSGKVLPDKSTMGNRLIHDYSIEAAAKDIAAKNFIHSAEYAGLIRNGILVAQNVPLDSAVSGEENDIPTDKISKTFQEPKGSMPVNYNPTNFFSFDFTGGIRLVIPKDQKTSDAIADGELKEIRKALAEFAEKFVQKESDEKSKDQN